jgi:hypothetical protein
VAARGEPVNEEAASPSPPAAWAYWPRWGGKSVLIPHIARTAAQAVADLLGEKPQCSIAVRIPVRPGGHDCEQVDSPEKFQEGVSLEALRRFDSARIFVRHPKLEVEVALARAPGFGPEWLERGVLLEVRAADCGIKSKEVCGIRDRVLWAVSRGSPRFHAKIEFGEGSTPVPRNLTRRRAVAWVDEHFGRGAISRLAKSMPDPRKLRDVTVSTTAESSQFADTSADTRTRQLDSGLNGEPPNAADRFQWDKITADPNEMRKFRLRIKNTPPDVEDYLLKEHPGWIDHPESARPLRWILENSYWIWPVVVTFVSGLVSPRWGDVVSFAIGAALLGLFISYHLAKRLFPPVQLTDVGRVRYILARIGTWIIGPGVGVMLFVVGKWLR